MDEPLDLIGIYEIAELSGVSPPAVANWRKRAADFPKPVADLKSGPVFRKGEVRMWLKKRRKSVSTVIATINLKGGVGKTTTTVAVAQIMCVEFGKKVLIIDLDAQTNATVMLIGDEKWKELNDNEFTLARLFRDALADPDARRFNLDRTLQRRVSDVAEVRTLDLLPSSLDLIGIQDGLGMMPRGPFFSNSPVDILRKAIRSIIDEYDCVLIDCPPNLGLITLNGLRIAHGYIIPVIPDVLSTYGIPQIVKRVKDFACEVGEVIDPLGIVISMYRGQGKLHETTVRELRRKEKDAPVFDTIIPYATKMAEAAEFTQHSTLRQKFAYGDRYDNYRALTKEIIERAGT